MGESEGVQRTLCLATGIGPVGTGVHLLRPIEDSAQEKVAEAWLTLLFLPLVPLGTWMLVPEPGRSDQWVLRGVRPPGVARSVATVVRFYVSAALTFVPGYVVVAFFMGNKVLELAGLFSTAGLIVGLLAWLDSTRERIPLRILARARRGNGR
jgi:hypothetical protein